MKILNVLLVENAMLAYRDLTDTQTTVLRRLTVGKTAYDTASEREKAVIDELVDFGLVDNLSFEPNQRGQAVANLATKYGSHDGREVARRSSAMGVQGFEGRKRYSDVGDLGDNVEPGDDMATMSGGARAIERGELVR